MTFTLAKLHSLFVEQSNVNGSLLTVHYLVKNSPFKIDFQMDPSNVEGLKLRLFTQDTEREVTLAKNEPLTFRVLPSNSRNLVSVEVRIQVLSSSMEGSLFVIVAEKDNCRVTTQPLKVVSKLEQVRAAIKRAGGSSLTDEASSEDDIDENPTPNLKKRKVPVSDQVLHELEVIKKQQQEQMALLSTLAKLRSTGVPELELDPAFSRPSKRRKTAEIDTPAATPSFEQALGTFLSAFAALPADERTTRITCFLTQQPSLVSAATDAASILGQSNTAPGNCTCADCPYRAQMTSLFNQLLPQNDESSSETAPDFATSGFGTNDDFTSMTGVQFC